MSEQRLSKLQKWILENCFKVTVLLDRTELKALKNAGTSWKCRECLKTGENVRLTKHQTHLCKNDGFICPYFNFYKEDVLLSFFMLTPRNDIIHINRVQHFHDSPDYSKAHVSVHRSIKNMIDKEFVYTLNDFTEYSLQICLTNKGITKAAELLKISEYEHLIGR